MYQSTKSYMSVEGQSTKTFQTSLRIQQIGNEIPGLFKLYIDFALQIYLHRWKVMGTDHLSILYDISNEST